MSVTKPYSNARWGVPTAAECAASCIANAEHSAREESRCRQFLATLVPGDSQRPGMISQISRHASDQAHWRSLAAFWRKESGPAAKVLAMPMPEPDRRLPREPGDDEEELAF